MIFVKLSIKIQILRLFYEFYECSQFFINLLNLSISPSTEFINFLNLSIYQLKKFINLLNLIISTIYQIYQFTPRFCFCNISQYFTSHFYKNSKKKQRTKKLQILLSILQRFKNTVCTIQNMADPQSLAPRYEAEGGFQTRGKTCHICDWTHTFLESQNIVFC